MRTVLLLAVSGLALAACKPSVSLTNASPEEVAEAAKASGAEAIQLRPGQWETKVEMVDLQLPDMKGMPAQVAERMRAEMSKPHSVSSCMTEEDVKNHGTKMFGDAGNKCKYDKYEMSGGHVDAVMSCPSERGATKLHMTGTFAADSFEVQQEMDMDLGVGGTTHTKARVTGKRVGECKPGAK